MKPATLFATVSFLSVLAAHAAHAEDASGPSPDVKKLVRLAGNWRGTGSFTSEGKKTPFTWQMNCSLVAQGFGVQCRFGARGIPIIPRYDGSSIVGWDKETQTVHWYWVTNAGETHDHHGRWTDANSLDLPVEMKEGGKSVRETFTVNLVGAREMRWSSAYFIEGQQAMLFEASGRK